MKFTGQSGNVNTNNVIYINARSMLANFNEIELLCTNFKPQILACSETRITSDINECEYDISGYNAIVCHSSSRHTGGVVMYIKSDIKFKIVFNEAWENHLWFISLEIWNGCVAGLYHVFYRSPDKKFKSKSLSNILEKYFRNTIGVNKFNIMMGDLNVNMNKSDALQTKINNLIMKYGLNVMNNFDTRISGTSRTKIDLILSNKVDLIGCSPLQNEEITDHETVLIKFLNKERCENRQREILSWRNYNKEKLIDNLRKCSWNSFDCLSIDSKIVLLRENLYNATETLVKRIKTKSNIKKKPWFNRNLMEMKRKKVQVSRIRK